MLLLLQPAQYLTSRIHTAGYFGQEQSSDRLNYHSQFVLDLHVVLSAFESLKYFQSFVDAINLVNFDKSSDCFGFVTEYPADRGPCKGQMYKSILSYLAVSIVHSENTDVMLQMMNPFVINCPAFFFKIWVTCRV